MAHLGHDAFKVHRDDRLVLDDQHRTRCVAGHFAIGDLDQLRGFTFLDPHHCGDLPRAQFLDCVQQQRLAGVGRQLGQAIAGLGGWTRLFRIRGHRTARTAPDSVESAEKCDLGIQSGIILGRIGQDRLKRRAGIGIPA